jgi:hypothetical protein
MNTNTLDRKSLDKTADDICELMDNLGFSAEYPIDQNDLRSMIVDVLLKNLDRTPVLITGVNPEPFELSSTTDNCSDCGSQSGRGYERQPGE